MPQTTQEKKTTQPTSVQERDRLIKEYDSKGLEKTYPFETLLAVGSLAKPAIGLTRGAVSGVRALSRAFAREPSTEKQVMKLITKIINEGVRRGAWKPGSRGTIKASGKELQDTLAMLDKMKSELIHRRRELLRLENLDLKGQINAKSYPLYARVERLTKARIKELQRLMTELAKYIPGD